MLRRVACRTRQTGSEAAANHTQRREQGFVPPTLRPFLFDYIPNHPPSLWIQASARLVQKYNLGIGDQRDSKGQSAQHTTRELASRLTKGVAVQLNCFRDYRPAFHPYDQVSSYCQ